MPTIRELRANAQKCLESARTLNEGYEKQYGKGYMKKDDLPDDVRETVNSASTKYVEARNALTKRIEEESNSFDSILGDNLNFNPAAGNPDKSAGGSGDDAVPPKTRGGRSRNRGSREENRTHYSWRSKGSRHTCSIPVGPNSQQRLDTLMFKMLPEHPMARSNFARHVQAGRDKNVLVDEIDAKGGYFTVHEKLMAGILKNVDDDVFMMRAARKLFLNDAKSISTLVRTAKASSFAFTNALTDITDMMEDSLQYGKKTWTPHQYMGSFWIHRDLIESAVISPIGLMMEEMEIDLREMFEDQFLYGTGTSNGHSAPLGVMTADSRGISTGRDISTGSTTTAFTGDSFIRAKYNQKRKYRRSSTFLLHRNTIATAATLKDTTNNYIWKASLAAGEPDTMCGLPVEESEWMSYATGASNYYGILGDFSYYWVVISKLMEMQRLDELAARYNLVEFHLRGKVDAAPALEEAFTRLQFAAA